MSTAVQPAHCSIRAHARRSSRWPIGVQRHRARSRQEFLLRISGPAKTQAPCSVCGVRLHAALRRSSPTIPASRRASAAPGWRHGWIAFHHAQAGKPTDDPVLLALTDAQRRYQIPSELLDSWPSAPRWTCPRATT